MTPAHSVRMSSRSCGAFDQVVLLVRVAFLLLGIGALLLGVTALLDRWTLVRVPLLMFGVAALLGGVAAFLDGQPCRLEEWWVRYAVQTTVNGRSELLIFLQRASQP